MGAKDRNFRTVGSPLSATYSDPTVSWARNLRVTNVAAVAGPSSPDRPEPPFPAIVYKRVLVAGRNRILLLPASTMNTSPEEATTRPHGELRVLEVAGNPSPLKLAVGIPAMVERMELVEIMRTM